MTLDLRGQSGMTLIELVLALAITSIVLLALSGVVFGANLVSSSWTRQTRFTQTEPLLPDRLQADAHRYFPCTGAAAAHELRLCLPGGQEAVAYRVRSACPCDLVRTDSLSGGSALVVRNLEAPPDFAATCRPAGPVAAGSISITLRYQGDAAPRPPVTVYYRAPAGSCS